MFLSTYYVLGMASVLTECGKGTGCCNDTDGDLAGLDGQEEWVVYMVNKAS